MYNLKKHYKKILKLTRKEILNSSTDELITLYDMLDDCFDVGSSKTFNFEDGSQTTVIITGIYRCINCNIYSFTSDECEIKFIIEKQGVCSFINLDTVHSKLIKTKTTLAKQSTLKRQTMLLILLAIAIFSLPCLLKDSDFLNSELITYTNSIYNPESSGESIYREVQDSVVLIKIYNDEGTSMASASGMIVSEDGFLISCAHIYNEIYNPKFKIVFNNGKFYDAVFIAGDVESDSCILKITNTNDKFKPIQFANSDKIDHGDVVYTVGYPGGITVAPIISSGIVSSTDVKQTNLAGYQNSYIQTDAAANPGSSGGALLDNRGRVIGMITSKLATANYENTIYSVSSKQLKSVVNSLYKLGYVLRPTLGITFTEILPNEIDAGLPYGSKVASINETSGAFGLIDESEIITACNGVELRYGYGLYEALVSMENKTITMTVYNSEKDEYRDVSFAVYYRTSTDGLLTGNPPVDDENTDDSSASANK